jgi:hypothetical protein
MNILFQKNWRNIIKMKNIIRINFILILIVLMGGISFAEENKIYFIELGFDNGEINLVDVSLKQGAGPNLNSQKEQYTAKIISLNDEKIYSYEFKITTTLNIPPAMEGEENFQAIELTETTYSLVLPYFIKGEFINIYDSENELVLEINIKEFAKYCGDKKCNLDESEISCPEDCGISAEKINFFQQYKYWIFGLIIFVLLIVGIIFTIKSLAKNNLKEVQE